MRRDIRFDLHVKADAFSLGDIKASWSKPINIEDCKAFARSGIYTSNAQLTRRLAACYLLVQAASFTCQYRMLRQGWSVSQQRWMLTSTHLHAHQRRKCQGRKLNAFSLRPHDGNQFASSRPRGWRQKRIIALIMARQAPGRSQPGTRRVASHGSWSCAGGNRAGAMMECECKCARVALLVSINLYAALEKEYAS